MTTIAELAEDRTVEGVYAVARKDRKRTRHGAAYLALELSCHDCSPFLRRSLVGQYS